MSNERVRSQPMRRRRLTRDESQADTRAELLTAANRLFLRDGYAATSLAAIAEEAALTKGAVYSNFDSKEDLFLTVMREAGATAEWYAPDDVSRAEGDEPGEQAASFGRYAASVKPSRRHVALFLEMNAAALRSEPVRRRAVNRNAEFFETFGAAFGAALGIKVDNPHRLGLILQSLYVGLIMHGAFDGGRDEETFAAAYQLVVLGHQVGV